jgi:NitT/TauT family transport system substrate-binding protein
VKGFADLKGKTIGVSAPGTAPYFGLAWMLNKNGMTLKDVKLVSLEPQPAAQAFVAGQNDAAMTYEPYLSTVRANPTAGKILATTLDYPMVMDTVGCAPTWLKANAKAAQALTQSYFEALEMIKADPAKANELMGSAVKQTGEQFAKSSAYLRWQDKAANQKFFAGELTSFMKEATAILLEAGVIRKAPEDYAAMFDASFVK